MMCMCYFIKNFKKKKVFAIAVLSYFSGMPEYTVRCLSVNLKTQILQSSTNHKEPCRGQFTCAWEWNGAWAETAILANTEATTSIQLLCGRMVVANTEDTEDVCGNMLKVLGLGWDDDSFDVILHIVTEVQYHAVHCIAAQCSAVQCNIVQYSAAQRAAPWLFCQTAHMVDGAASCHNPS